MVVDVAVGLESVAVHQNVLWPDFQCVQGFVHGQDGGVEYVYFVNFLVVHLGHGPSHGLPFDELAQFFPFFGRELFRVVQCFVGKAVGQDDGRRKDGSRQATPSRLVASGFNPVVEVFQSKHIPQLTSVFRVIVANI